MSGVTPAKGDLLVGEGDQSVVGDGYAMDVTAQIAEYMLRPSERWFRVDHPVVAARQQRFSVERGVASLHES